MAGPATLTLHSAPFEEHDVLAPVKIDRGYRFTFGYTVDDLETGDVRQPLRRRALELELDPPAPRRPSECVHIPRCDDATAVHEPTARRSTVVTPFAAARHCAAQISTILSALRSRPQVADRQALSS